MQKEGFIHRRDKTSSLAVVGHSKDNGETHCIPSRTLKEAKGFLRIINRHG